VLSVRRSLLLLSAASAALHLTITRAQADSSNGLAATTGTGTYTGIINWTAPNVRQFLNIPYSVSPIGDRRWLPPAKVTTNSSSKIDATQYLPSCPQYVSNGPSIYNQDFTQYQIIDGAESFTAGLFADATSEDCLSLAIWTPPQNAQKLPVALFMTGGGFYTGGINIPYQLPYHWVQRTQAHIVVTIT
jgi:carboxylesterase type B